MSTLPIWILLQAVALRFTLPSTFSTVTPVPFTVEAVQADSTVDTTLSGVLSLQLITAQGQRLLSQYYTPLSVLMQQGVAQGTLQVYRADTGYVLEATAPGGLVDTSASFSVSPGPYDRMVLLLPGESLDAGYPGGGRIGAPVPTIYAADTTIPYRVLYVDTYWNPIPGQTDTLSAQGLNSAGTGSLARFQLNVPVSHGDTLWARARVADSAFRVVVRSVRLAVQDTSSPLQIIPSTAARLVLIAPGMQLFPGDTTGNGYSGSPAPAYVGITHPLDVYLTDSLFNPVLNPSPYGADTVELRVAPSQGVQISAPQPVQSGNPLAFTVDFSQPGPAFQIMAVDRNDTTFLSNPLTLPVYLRPESLWIQPQRDTLPPASWDTLFIHLQAAGGLPIPGAQIQVQLQGPGTLLGIQTVTDSQGIARAYYGAPYTLQPLTAQVVAQFTSGPYTLSDTHVLYIAVTTDSLFLIYPNPLTSPPGLLHFRVYIPLASGIRDAQVQVFDMVGNLVWEGTVPASALVPGSYYDLTWNGFKKSGHRIAQGPYVAVYRVFGQSGDLILAAKQYFGVVW